MAGADAVEEAETDVHTEVVRMTVFIGQNYFAFSTDDRSMKADERPRALGCMIHHALTTESLAVHEIHYIHIAARKCRVARAELLNRFDIFLKGHFRTSGQARRPMPSCVALGLR